MPDIIGCILLRCRHTEAALLVADQLSTFHGDVPAVGKAHTARAADVPEGVALQNRAVHFPELDAALAAFVNFTVLDSDTAAVIRLHTQNAAAEEAAVIYCDPVAVPEFQYAAGAANTASIASSTTPANVEIFSIFLTSIVYYDLKN